MEDRILISNVLGRLGRRLWLGRVIRETALYACAAVFCLTCFRLIEPALAGGTPAAATVAWTAAGAVLLAAAIDCALRLRRRVGMAEAAAQADTRANLRDELKSAQCFLAASPPQSAMQALQLARAAVTASRLDPKALVPLGVPPAARVAGTAALLLALLAWVVPLPPVADVAIADPGARAPAADLKALLEGAPENDAQIEKLKLALETLQKNAADSTVRARALADARDAMDQADMEAANARETLARLTASMPGDPKFEGIGRALREGNPDEARTRLAQMAPPAAAGKDQSAEALAEPGDEGAQARDSLGRDLGSNAAYDQQAIKRLTQALDEARERIEVQNRVNALRRQMDSQLLPVKQSSQITANRFGNRTTDVNPQPSPETGNVDLRGGTLFHEAAATRGGDLQGHEGSVRGDASGESEALPLQGEAARRLDAQLKLEAIRDEREAAEADGSNETSRLPTRQQSSGTAYVDVRAGAYERAAATDHDTVTMSRRREVKTYFLNLHEGGQR